MCRCRMRNSQIRSDKPRINLMQQCLRLRRLQQRRNYNSLRFNIGKGTLTVKCQDEGQDDTQNQKTNGLPHFRFLNVGIITSGHILAHNKAPREGQRNTGLIRHVGCCNETKNEKQIYSGDCARGRMPYHICVLLQSLQLVVNCRIANFFLKKVFVTKRMLQVSSAPIFSSK